MHQHGDQLQFFNPHPDNEIQYHGYASSRWATSSHVNVVNDLSTTRGQETVESEAGQNEAGESEAVESEVVESEVDESETGESETVQIIESEVIDRETNEIEIAGDQVVTQDHNSVQLIPVADSNGAENQEEPAEGLSQATEHRAVASVPLDNSLQTSAALIERQDSNRAGGTFDLSPRDPITSRRTLEFVEDLLTPLQMVPMDSDHETTAEVRDSRTVLQ